MPNLKKNWKTKSSIESVWDKIVWVISFINIIPTMDYPLKEKFALKMIGKEQ